MEFSEIDLLDKGKKGDVVDRPEDPIIDHNSIKTLYGIRRNGLWTRRLAQVHIQMEESLKNFVAAVVAQVLSVSARSHRATRRFNTGSITQHLVRGVVMEVAGNLKERSFEG